MTFEIDKNGQLRIVFTMDVIAKTEPDTIVFSQEKTVELAEFLARIAETESQKKFLSTFGKIRNTFLGRK
jgi:hypothetical protein